MTSGVMDVVDGQLGRAHARSEGAGLAGALAVAGAALFTGAALVIAAAEQPARLALENGAMLTQWQLSYQSAAPIQGGLVLVSAALGAWAWRQSSDLRWLAGALVILANWPFTWFLIMPLNQPLLVAAPELAGALTRAQIETWGGLHLYRVGLGLGAIALFVTALMAGFRRRAGR